MKRILQMPDNRRFSLKYYGYNVKPNPLQGNASAPCEILCPVRHPAFLFPIDIAFGRAELGRGPGFDLHDDERIVLARYEI